MTPDERAQRLAEIVALGRQAEGEGGTLDAYMPQLHAIFRLCLDDFDDEDDT